MTKPIGRRADYRYFQSFTTLWRDNDVYRHVNNVVFYEWFDTVVARFLLEHGVLDLARSPTVGLVIETLCRYHAPIAFPDRVTAGLRAEHVGNSSVRYGIGIFREAEEQAAAEGHFVHVYVERERQSVKAPVPEALRAALAAIRLP